MTELKAAAEVAFALMRLRAFAYEEYKLSDVYERLRRGFLLLLELIDYDTDNRRREAAIIVDKLAAIEIPPPMPAQIAHDIASIVTPTTQAAAFITGLYRDMLVREFDKAGVRDLYISILSDARDELVRIAIIATA